MSYYHILGLSKEPFSTSPDPNLFYGAAGHKAALCRLQVTVALKRGLSVVLGDVGTGKTTLSRRLAQAMADDPDVVFRMVLNPYFRTEKQFLSRLAALFHVEVPGRSPTALDYMEAIERYLFRMGVEEQKTVVLLVDEAQILPDFVLEVLRILLNYETNECKILQVLLVGQLELLPRIVNMSNFWDRIALKVMLEPMGEADTHRMIDHRLRASGYAGVNPMFTPDAVARVHEHTSGFPRRVNLLCHHILEHMVMYDKRTVDIGLVDQVIARDVDADAFRHLLDDSALDMRKGLSGGTPSLDIPMPEDEESVDAEGKD